MPAYTQAYRPVRLATPLGDDVLLVRRLTGREPLGRLFQYELELLSERDNLDHRQIIGKNVTLAVDKGDKDPRFFNGFVSRFSQVTFEGRLLEYRATVVPWLWFLTRTSDCRVFQKMTIPEILKQVFQDHGFTDLSDRLHGTYQPWEYCVQYRESAFDFVSRLLEQEGIYYYFKHQNGRHTLVLCDTMGSHLEFPGYEELHYHPRHDGATVIESLWSWVVEHEVQPGGYRVRDFDFANPRRAADAATFQDRGDVGGQLEQYDYLGEMDAECQGERYSKLRLEEWQTGSETYQGEGDARGICTGVRFKLRGHPRTDLPPEYLVTAADYRIESASFETGAAAGAGFVYEAKLRAIPVTQEYRSPRTTRKPVIPGPQTAVVVGPAGEEIHTDKYGRVKVHFHWDRHGKADENASCWVRVAQVWAGKQWGALYTPRVGQEVVVEFLEGDPDRPLITGRVYNGTALPPYELPTHKTLSTLKSNSSKGGQGFNELRFDDQKGEEQFFLHAEKDLDVRVKHDRKEWVGNEAHQIVKKDQFESVEGGRHTTIKGDCLSQIDGDRGETVKGDHLVQVDGGEHLTVKGDQCAKVAGSANFKTDQHLNVEAGMKVSLKSGQDVHGKAGMNFAFEAGMVVHLKGAVSVVIEGGTQVSLKAGPSFIDIGPSGVAISGPMVLINSGGAAAAGSGSSPTAPAAPDPPDPPTAPKEAIKAEPGKTDEPPPASPPPQPKTLSPSAAVLKSAAATGAAFCEKCAE